MICPQTSAEIGEDAPSTANLCDAALADGNAIRLVTDLAPFRPEWSANGPARCVRHFGSVDVFLEAIDRASPGEVLVIDNDGRDDEGCIGDLVVLEAALAGLAGIVIWGRNRDSRELSEIGLPVFSRGHCSSGPRRLDPRENAFGRATIGSFDVGDGDRIVADSDGLLIFRANEYGRIHEQALEIRQTELQQSLQMRSGRTLREQLGLPDFVSARSTNASLTFRQHLRARGGAVEI